MTTVLISVHAADRGAAGEMEFAWSVAESS